MTKQKGGKMAEQWTPISKGYPTERGYYLVTIRGYLDDRLEPAVEYYIPNTARDKKRWKAINVIAWKKAEVYRGECSWAERRQDDREEGNPILNYIENERFIQHTREKYGYR